MINEIISMDINGLSLWAWEDWQLRMHATLSRVLVTYSIKSTNGKKSILFISLLDVVGILKSVFSVTLFLFVLNTSVTAGLWAYLAPQCYILSGPLQLSSELCRKIFLHVLAELCRFSASYSHSAGIPQDCPPARTKISSVHPQRLIVNRKWPLGGIVQPNIKKIYEHAAQILNLL